jgi:prepilin-type N-terminal cleavage/methylation domain-containing protein
MQKQSAFTLLELMAVMALMAILAGSVALSLKTPYQAAKFENAVERVIFMDRELRDHAMRYAASAEMRIELGNSTIISCVEPNKRETVMPKFTLGNGIQVEQVAFGKKRIDSGCAEIGFTEKGRSPTYAMRFSGGGKRQWLVFLGITGQVLRINDEKEFEATIQVMQSQWTDPD